MLNPHNVLLCSIQMSENGIYTQYRLKPGHVLKRKPKTDQYMRYAAISVRS